MDVNLKFTDRLGICKGSKGRVRFAGLTTPKYLQMRCHAANPLSISFHEQWCSQYHAILAVVLAVVLATLCNTSSGARSGAHNTSSGARNTISGARNTIVAA